MSSHSPVLPAAGSLVDDSLAAANASLTLAHTIESTLHTLLATPQESLWRF